MSRESTLQAGRQFQEDSFTETITAGVFAKTVDPDTLETIRTMVTEIYTGAALVKYPTLTVSEREAGGRQYAAGDIVVKLPIGAFLLPLDTVIIVDDSSADPSMIGREYRVKARPQSGQVTSHRYPVEETS